MKFNKYFIKFGKIYLILFTIIIVTFLYFCNNQFKVIEGNKFKDKGEDEEDGKNEANKAYTISDAVLPPADN